VVRVHVAEVEEAKVVAVVFDGHKLFDVLVCKILERELEVVGVEEELGEVFEL